MAVVRQAKMRPERYPWVANLLTDESIRCDVVSVLLGDKGEPVVDVIRNAVELGEVLGE